MEECGEDPPKLGGGSNDVPWSETKYSSQRERIEGVIYLFSGSINRRFPIMASWKKSRDERREQGRRRPAKIEKQRSYPQVKIGKKLPKADSRSGDKKINEFRWCRRGLWTPKGQPRRGGNFDCRKILL